MNNRQRLIGFISAIAIGLTAVTVPNHAVASPSANVVSSTADSGPGSLRDVIAAAAPGSIVTFGDFPGPSTIITLTSGPLSISKDLTIDGSAWPGLAISGNDTSRVISITAPVSVTLKALTITRGRVSGLCDVMPGGGGGIYAVGGRLTIEDSAIVRNQAVCGALGGLFPGGTGGGVYSGGVLIIRNSVLQENVTPQNAGGAAAVAAVQRLVLINVDVRENTGYSAISALPPTEIESSTIVSNVALGIDAGASLSNLSISNTTIMSNTTGGVLSGAVLTITNSLVSGHDNGISAYGPTIIRDSTVAGNRTNGISSNGELTLVNSTITGNGRGIIFIAVSSDPEARSVIASSTIVSNTADVPAGSGINVLTGTVEIANSIVAGNAITNNFAVAPGARIVSLGYNLTNSTDVLTATGDLTSTLPLLGPLQHNGGPTPTHELLAGSPGLDAGNPAGCMGADGAVLSGDQRGYPRSADGTGSGVSRCDIGAYERWVPVVSLSMPFLPTAR